MTNFFVMMTYAQSKRWEKTKSSGRPKYVLKRALLYGALIPSLIIWAFTLWTSFGKLVFLLLLFSLPVDYALARLSWVFQEYRYDNRQRALRASETPAPL